MSESRLGKVRWAELQDLVDCIPSEESSDTRLIAGTFKGSKIAAPPGLGMIGIGPSGSRKTTGLIIPNVYNHRGPVLATSVRDDVIRATYEERARQGPVYTYAPAGRLDSFPTHAWSPVEASKDRQVAGAMAAVFGTEGDVSKDKGTPNQKFWEKGGEKILGSTLYACAHAGPELRQSPVGEMTSVELLRSLAAKQDNKLLVPRQVFTQRYNEAVGKHNLLATVEQALREGAQFDEVINTLANQKATELIAAREKSQSEPANYQAQVTTYQLEGTLRQIIELDKQPPNSFDEFAPMIDAARAKTLDLDEDRTRLDVLASDDTPPETKSSYARLVDAITDAISTADAMAASRGPKIDFDQAIREGATVYTYAPPDKVNKAGPLLSMFTTCYVAKALELKPDPDALVALDEAGVVGPSQIADLSSLARANGVRPLIVVQSRAQLEDKYGKKDCETILTNIYTKVLFPGANHEDTEYFSEMIGKTTVEKETTTSDFLHSTGGSPTSVQVSTEEDYLVKSGQLRMLPTGHALVVGGNLPPVVVELKYLNNMPDADGKHAINNAGSMTYLENGTKTPGNEKRTKNDRTSI